MLQTFATKMKKFYLLCMCCLLFYGCKDWGVDTYEIKDVSKKQIFRPEVRSLFSSDGYSIHVEGIIDGETEIYVLPPNADIHKQRNCSVADWPKMKAGKVNRLYNGSCYFKPGEKPYLYYLPCTAKKGHLKVRISFTHYLKKG